MLDVDPAARREDDFYRTPRWMTEALLRRIQLKSEWTIFEPAAGDGAIVRPLRERNLSVLTNDLVIRPPFELELQGDARTPATWDAARQMFGRIDVSVSNLPFDVAFPIMQLAHYWSRIGVALLLRISIVEPTDDPRRKKPETARGPWLAEHPPARMIVLPRHSFRGVGSDMATCCWFVWNTGGTLCVPGIDVVTKGERDELIAKYGKGV